MAYFNFQNKKVYYEVHGEGKPLVILNGIMMSTASWKPFVDVFSQQNKLVLVDFLDQGQSDKLVNKTYTQQLQVDVINALFEHLNLTNVSLMGISYGGEVAQQFAVQYQSKLERLLLFNTCAYTSPLLGDIGKAWNLAAESKSGEAYYYTTIPVIYSPAYYARRLEWMRNREKVLIPVFANPTFSEAMVRLTKSADTHDVRKQLGEITIPTLVVSSDQDMITPMLEQDLMVKGLKNAHHVILTNTGHASMYEQPLLFASLVFGFVNVKATDYQI